MATRKTAAKKESNTGLTVGLALGAIGAVAAGYFLYGPKGEANRKKLKGWMLKAKGEVLEKLEKVKDSLDEETYNAIVDQAVAKYGKMKDVGMDNAMMLGGVLKKHWKGIKKDLSAAPKKSAKKKAAPKKK